MRKLQCNEGLVRKHQSCQIDRLFYDPWLFPASRRVEGKIFMSSGDFKDTPQNLIRVKMRLIAPITRQASASTHWKAGTYEFVDFLLIGVSHYKTSSLLRTVFFLLEEMLFVPDALFTVSFYSYKIIDSTQICFLWKFKLCFTLILLPLM